MNQTIVSIFHDQTEIPCTVIFSKSRKKTIQIKVTQERLVYVYAPRMPLAQVQQMLDSKAAWISKQLARVKEIDPIFQQKQYCAGEEFLYLGERYRLNLLPSRRPAVSVHRDCLLVSHPQHMDPIKVGSYVDRWYSKQAKEKIAHRLDHVLSLFVEHQLPEPQLQVRRYKRKWGQCTNTNVITINREVIKTPEHCIDAVLIHELCHLLELNHSTRFYSLLAQFNPAWKEREKELQSYAPLLARHAGL